MKTKIFHKKRVRKILSLCIVYLMIFSQIGYTKNDAGRKLKFDIKLGHIRESFNAPSDKMIIHIQDAHCVYEAQSNIIAIVNDLHKNNNVSLVTLEGADGYFNIDTFTSFPLKDSRQNVADYFLKNGRISGAEYLMIENDLPLVFRGAENSDLYIDNYNSFLKALPSNNIKVSNKMKQIKSALNNLKKHIFNEQLVSFDNYSDQYDRGEIPLSEFLIYLKNSADENNLSIDTFKNVSKFFEAKNAEQKINFKSIHTETANLINRLTDITNKKQLNKLLYKHLFYKLGKSDPSEFFTYLEKLIDEYDLDMSSFENVSLYSNYLNLYKAISASKLTEETNTLLSNLKEKLSHNDTEKKLVRLLKNAQILDKLLSLKITKAEYKHYQTNKNLFKTDSFTNFIKQQAPIYQVPFDTYQDFSIIDNHIPILDNFYTIAAKRNEALIENTLSEMDLEDTNIAILITGGFHTEGITDLLREQEISYRVISPSITQPITTTSYLERLCGIPTEAEEMLSANRLSVPLVLGEKDLVKDAQKKNQFITTFKSLLDIDSLTKDLPKNYTATITHLDAFTIQNYPVTNDKGIITTESVNFLAFQLMGKTFYVAILPKNMTLPETIKTIQVADKNIITMDENTFLAAQQDALRTPIMVASNNIDYYLDTAMTAGYHSTPNETLLQDMDIDITSLKENNFLEETQLAGKRSFKPTFAYLVRSTASPARIQPKIANVNGLALNTETKQYLSDNRIKQIAVFSNRSDISPEEASELNNRLLNLLKNNKLTLSSGKNVYAVVQDGVAQVFSTENTVLRPFAIIPHSLFESMYPQYNQVKLLSATEAATQGYISVGFNNGLVTVTLYEIDQYGNQKPFKTFTTKPNASEIEIFDLVLKARQIASDNSIGLLGYGNPNEGIEITFDNLDDLLKTLNGKALRQASLNVFSMLSIAPSMKSLEKESLQKQGVKSLQQLSDFIQEQTPQKFPMSTCTAYAAAIIPYGPNNIGMNTNMNDVIDLTNIIIDDIDNKKYTASPETHFEKFSEECRKMSLKVNGIRTYASFEKLFTEEEMKTLKKFANNPLFVNIINRSIGFMDWNDKILVNALKFSQELRNISDIMSKGLNNLKTRQLEDFNLMTAEEKYSKDFNQYTHFLLQLMMFSDSQNRPDGIKVVDGQVHNSMFAVTNALKMLGHNSQALSLVPEGTTLSGRDKLQKLKNILEALPGETVIIALNYQGKEHFISIKKVPLGFQILDPIASDTEGKAVTTFAGISNLIDRYIPEINYDEESFTGNIIVGQTVQETNRVLTSIIENGMARYLTRAEQLSITGAIMSPEMMVQATSLTLNTNLSNPLISQEILMIVRDRFEKMLLSNQYQKIKVDNKTYDITSPDTGMEYWYTVFGKSGFKNTDGTPLDHKTPESDATKQVIATVWKIFTALKTHKININEYIANHLIPIVDEKIFPVALTGMWGMHNVNNSIGNTNPLIETSITTLYTILKHLNNIKMAPDINTLRSSYYWIRVLQKAGIAESWKQAIPVIDYLIEEALSRQMREKPTTYTDSDIVNYMRSVLSLYTAINSNITKHLETDEIEKIRTAHTNHFLGTVSQETLKIVYSHLKSIQAEQETEEFLDDILMDETEAIETITELTDTNKLGKYWSDVFEKVAEDKDGKIKNLKLYETEGKKLVSYLISASINIYNIDSPKGAKPAIDNDFVLNAMMSTIKPFVIAMDLEDIVDQKENQLETITTVYNQFIQISNGLKTLTKDTPPEQRKNLQNQLIQLGQSFYDTYTTATMQSLLGKTQFEKISHEVDTVLAYVNRLFESFNYTPTSQAELEKHNAMWQKFNTILNADNPNSNMAKIVKVIADKHAEITGTTVEKTADPAYVRSLVSNIEKISELLDSSRQIIDSIEQLPTDQMRDTFNALGNNFHDLEKLIDPFLPTNINVQTINNTDQLNITKLITNFDLIKTQIDTIRSLSLTMSKLAKPTWLNYWKKEGLAQYNSLGSLKNNLPGAILELSNSLKNRLPAEEITEKKPVLTKEETLEKQNTAMEREGVNQSTMIAELAVDIKDRVLAIQKTRSDEEFINQFNDLMIDVKNIDIHLKKLQTPEMKNVLTQKDLNDLNNLQAEIRNIVVNIKEIYAEIEDNPQQAKNDLAVLWLLSLKTSLQKIHDPSLRGSGSVDNLSISFINKITDRSAARKKIKQPIEEQPVTEPVKQEIDPLAKQKAVLEQKAVATTKTIIEKLKTIRERVYASTRANVTLSLIPGRLDGIMGLLAEIESGMSTLKSSDMNLILNSTEIDRIKNLSTGITGIRNIVNPIVQALQKKKNNPAAQIAARQSLRNSWNKTGGIKTALDNVYSVTDTSPSLSQNLLRSFIAKETKRAKGNREAQPEDTDITLAHEDTDISSKKLTLQIMLDFSSVFDTFTEKKFFEQAFQPGFWKTVIFTDQINGKYKTNVPSLFQENKALIEQILNRVKNLDNKNMIQAISNLRSAINHEIDTPIKPVHNRFSQEFLGSINDIAQALGLKENELGDFISQGAFSLQNINGQWQIEGLPRNALAIISHIQNIPVELNTSKGIYHELVESILKQQPDIVDFFTTTLQESSPESESFKVKQILLNSFAQRYNMNDSSLSELVAEAIAKVFTNDILPTENVSDYYKQPEGDLLTAFIKMNLLGYDSDILRILHTNNQIAPQENVKRITEAMENASLMLPNGIEEAITNKQLEKWFNTVFNAELLAAINLHKNQSFAEAVKKGVTSPRVINSIKLAQKRAQLKNTLPTLTAMDANFFLNEVVAEIITNPEKYKDTRELSKLVAKHGGISDSKTLGIAQMIQEYLANEDNIFVIYSNLYDTQTIQRILDLYSISSQNIVIVDADLLADMNQANPILGLPQAIQANLPSMEPGMTIEMSDLVLISADKRQAAITADAGAKVYLSPSGILPQEFTVGKKLAIGFNIFQAATKMAQGKDQYGNLLIAYVGNENIFMRELIKQIKNKKGSDIVTLKELVDELGGVQALGELARSDVEGIVLSFPERKIQASDLKNDFMKHLTIQRAIETAA